VRKLLVVTYHFPPSAASGVFRMLGFARHLPKFGWQAVVVAPPRMPSEATDPELLRQVPEETVVYPAPFPEGLMGRAVRRLLPEAVWLPRAWAASRRAIREHQPDALLTSSPPHGVHVLGLFLKRQFGLRWVADFRDLWITGAKPCRGRRVRAWCERRWEKAVMKHADAVVANTPRAGQTLQDAFPEHAHKVQAITNGYDPTSFGAPSPLLPLNAVLRIVHTGELYSGRDPRPFLDVLRDLDGEPSVCGKPFRARFLGRTTVSDLDLEAEVRQRRLEAVVDLGGQVPYAQSLQDMAASDILLLLDSPGRRVGIPAKLYEYLGAGRPILALAEPDGDVAWALRQSGVPHRLAPSRDAGRIKQALVELMTDLTGGRLTPAPYERLFAFTREHMAQALAETLNDGPGAVVPAARAEPSDTMGSTS
jgi:glycosyltransferase involved in cell wall biosynthesis